MAPPADRPRRRSTRRAVAGFVALVAGATVLGAGVLRGVGAGAATPSGHEPATSAAASGSTGTGLLASESASAPAVASAEPPVSAAPSIRPPSTGPTPAERRAAIVRIRLQAELDRLRRQLGIPGVSVTIVFPDGSRWQGVSGYADVVAQRPVTPDTAFAIASVSKTFTSALILGLAAEGRLRLSAPAAGLLPPLRFKLDPRITVAMLLNHTSGLADYFLNPKIDVALQKVRSAIWTAEQALGYVRKPLSPPGKAWHYANTNYLLLGLIAERVTGQPYAQLVRTRLLDPTGLRATWVQAGEPARVDLAHGYRLVGTKKPFRIVDLADGTGIAPFQSVITAAGAAGSIASTSDDLATWARSLYGGAVLGPAGTGLLLGGFTPTTAYLPGVAYGYGVQALSIDGHPSLGHSGRLLGFRSALRSFPIDGVTIAVLTNQSRADPGILVRRLLRIALPTAGACPGCPLER